VADYLTLYERACFLAKKHARLEVAERYLIRKGLLCFGIEHISACGKSMDFINMGDTYDTTIVCEGGEYIVSTWGGWLEDVETEYCEEEGMIQCSHCSKFTPIEEGDNWHDVSCESCGNFVDGTDST